MEGRLSVLEKWASEQGRVMAEWKTDMDMIKEGLLDLKELKELLKTSKKWIKARRVVRILSMAKKEEKEVLK